KKSGPRYSEKSPRLRHPRLRSDRSSTRSTPSRRAIFRMVPTSSSTNDGMTIRVSPLKKHAAGDGESPFIQKISKRCWTRFGPSGPQGSRVSSNTACGGTMGNIAGSCSVLNRCVTSSATSSDGTERILILRTSSGQKRSEEHTSELQSRGHLVCRLLLEKKKK